MGKGFVVLSLASAAAIGAMSAGLSPASARGTAAAPRVVAASTTADVSNAAIVQTALQYLGYRYTTVGNSPEKGFSCIGFVSYVYQTNGVPLPDDLELAMNYAPPVGFADLQPGDLLFFQNTVWKGLSHVAIYLGGGKFVHAEWYNRGVVISSFNNDPIDGNYWIAKYLGANRPWTGPASPVIPVPPPTPMPSPAVGPAAVAVQPAGSGTTASVAVWLLNVRATPKKTGTVVQVLPRGTAVTIIEERAGWYQVRMADGTTGWVVRAGLTTEQTTASTSAPVSGKTLIGSFPRVTVPVGALNLRATPSLQARIVTVLRQGDRVEVLDRTPAWAQVRTVKGLVGWVSTPLLYTASTGTAAHVVRHAAVVAVTVRVHAAPSVRARVVTVAAKGTRVQVLRRKAGWAYIQGPRSVTGYVVSSYIR
jgi:uncharacterized protein YgiM (DUF1202 family)